MRSLIDFAIRLALTLDPESEIQQVGLRVVVENDFKQRLKRHFIFFLTLRTLMLRNLLNFPPLSLKFNLIGKLINISSSVCLRLFLLSEQHLNCPELNVMLFFLGEQRLVVGIYKFMIFFPLFLLLLELVLPVFAKSLQLVRLACRGDNHA